MNPTHVKRQYALLLGTNLSDKLSQLRRARIQISMRIGLICRQSSIYETAPWGETDQDSFLNQAILLSSSLEPQDLLDKLKTIELLLGKNKTTKWGPRMIDIDILLSDDLKLRTKDLVIPHPRMLSRNFVLIPLSEIAGAAIHPTEMMSINHLKEACQDDGLVKKLEIEE